MIPQKVIGSSYLARYILLNAVDISDYQVFPERDIQNRPPAFQFPPSDQADAPTTLLDQPFPVLIDRPQVETIDQFLARNGTTAFILIHKDRLNCERYYNGYERSSICTSFSTVKSFVSALIGIALHDRLIMHIDDLLTMYLPELVGANWPAITIRHLVGMCSGLHYNAHGFFPWNDEPRVYYSLDLRKLARKARPVEPPGARFHYNNYNLILLGMVLERTTGGTVSEYLQEKIWKPLGMEFPASWSLDSKRNGMEKMESGLNARAVDFAKFGRLYLHRGEWDGRQIIPESWVVESTTIAPDARWINYKYLWWIPRLGQGRFMAVGNLGQFIFIAPDKDCIILRFGRGSPKNWHMVYPQLFNSLVETLL